MLFNAVNCDALMPIIRLIRDGVIPLIQIGIPIILIVLGMLDLGKAVMASKEDEMRKAQKTFIKRIIIGVAFFFIPALVNIIMWLANIVWNGMYPTCGL